MPNEKLPEEEEGVPMAVGLALFHHGDGPPPPPPPQNSTNTSKKRGRKTPRSQQPNRRRARVDNNSDNDSHVVETRIVPLNEEEDDEEVEKPTCFGWIRTVQPYAYTFTSHAKGRWVGRTVLDVYTSEFGSYPASYYPAAIAQGRIQVNNHMSTSQQSNNNAIVDTASYRIQAQDVLSHTVHRHEPAVAVSNNKQAPYVTIVAETDSLLVVDKPATLPIHSCGGYHHNSLVNLLETTTSRGCQNEKKKLYTIHRLDRLTSGCTILAKTPTVATEWGKLIQERSCCEKLYLARVRGQFPLNNDCCRLLLPRLNLLPVHGEWPSLTLSSTSEAATAAPCPPLSKKQKKMLNDPMVNAEKTAKLRHLTYAHGYWITDARSRADDDLSSCSSNLRNDVSVDQFVAAANHSIEDWLEVLDPIKKSNANNNNNNDNNKDNYYWFHVACPTRVEDPKIGVCKSGTFDDLFLPNNDNSIALQRQQHYEEYVRTVKPAETAIALIQYDAASDTSILLCQPETGRTHQIRTILQHLGHPIANDPNYGGDLWYNNPKGADACRRAQEILDRISRIPPPPTTTDAAVAAEAAGAAGADDCSRNRNNNNNSLTTTTTATTKTGLVTSDEPATNEEVEHILAQAPRQPDEQMPDYIRRTCVWCHRSRSCSSKNTKCNSSSTSSVNGSGAAAGHNEHEEQYDRALLEFLVRSPGIWLHALQYSIFADAAVGRDEPVSFRTDIPEWCKITKEQLPPTITKKDDT